MSKHRRFSSGGLIKDLSLRARRFARQAVQSVKIRKEGYQLGVLSSVDLGISLLLNNRGKGE